MAISITALTEKLKDALWRFYPPLSARLRHSVDGDGSHRFELTLAADEVQDDRPRTDHKPTTWGATTPEARGPKK